MPSYVDGDILAARPGANNQYDLAGKFFRISEINRVNDAAPPPVLRPLVRSIAGCPLRELWEVEISTRYDQVVKTPRDLGMVTHGIVTEWDNLHLRSVS